MDKKIALVYSKSLQKELHGVLHCSSTIRAASAADHLLEEEGTQVGLHRLEREEGILRGRAEEWASPLKRWAGGSCSLGMEVGQSCMEVGRAGMEVGQMIV